MDINIEHLRKEHLDEVWTLNFKAWYEDDSNSYDIDSVKARANLDLRDMLAVGTYALVAVDGEKVVGIAIANSVYSDNTIAMYDGSSTEDAF